MDTQTFCHNEPNKKVRAKTLRTFTIGGREGIVAASGELHTMPSSFRDVGDVVDVQWFLIIERRSNAHIQNIFLWILVPNWSKYRV